MYRIFREIKQDEYFVIGGDCSQGGKDANYGQFFSTTQMDFPIVYESHGVAATMTNDIFPALEWVYDKTGVKPMVCFERNNGGGSEMERLKALNRNQKYDLFLMPKIGSNDDTTRTELGWNTDIASRPVLLGEYKNAIDAMLLRHYDSKTIAQHKTFIVNRNNKPEAERGFHDDAIIASAICWQLYQRCPKPHGTYSYATARSNQEKLEKWSIQ